MYALGHGEPGDGRDVRQLLDGLPIEALLVGKGGDRRRHRAIQQPVDCGAPPPRAGHRREHDAGRERHEKPHDQQGPLPAPEIQADPQPHGAHGAVPMERTYARPSTIRRALSCLCEGVLPSPHPLVDRRSGGMEGMTEPDPHAAHLRARHRPAHARRRADRFAAFLLAELEPGMRLLDIGSGPGTITEGLATAVHPAVAVGIDFDPTPAEGTDVTVATADGEPSPLRLRHLRRRVRVCCPAARRRPRRPARGGASGVPTRSGHRCRRRGLGRVRRASA